jgi:malate/lactate dehydrogenase
MKTTLSKAVIMNIFATSPCPIQSAKALDDKRIVKMCSESLQLLVTALHANVIGDIGLTKFANCAANESLGINYKHVANVHDAYQLYLNHRCEYTDKNATWYGVGK